MLHTILVKFGLEVFEKKMLTDDARPQTPTQSNRSPEWLRWPKKSSSFFVINLCLLYFGLVMLCTFHLLKFVSAPCCLHCRNSLSVVNISLMRNLNSFFQQAVWFNIYFIFYILLNIKTNYAYRLLFISLEKQINRTFRPYFDSLRCAVHSKFSRAKHL